MFNLQGSEIIFILLIALVVLGPEKLPGAIRRVTSLYAELRKLSSGFQDEFKSVLDEPLREMKSTADLMKGAADPKRIAEDAEREAEAHADSAKREKARQAQQTTTAMREVRPDAAAATNDSIDAFADPVDEDEVGEGALGGAGDEAGAAATDDESASDDRPENGPEPDANDDPEPAVDRDVNVVSGGDREDDTASAPTQDLASADLDFEPEEKSA